MKIVFSKEIDNILSTKGIFLESIGINNWALSDKDVLFVLEQFDNMHIAVLGGDVCEKKDNDKMQLNYDSWHYEKDLNKLESEYINDSLRYAELYIKNYNGLSNNIYFILVPDV